MKPDDPEISKCQQESQSQSQPQFAASSEVLGENTFRPSDDLPAKTKTKPHVSSRKIEANRENSRRSTGPQTSIGKKRVSQNAVRHGFFSKFLLIQHRDGKESQEEYEDFYTDVRNSYEPAGFLEELWAEKIAVWSWRLRRLIRCESGQISRALAGHNYQIRQSKISDATDLEAEPSTSSELNAITDHLFLPEWEELDKLLRYEAMINRQLHHAIAELERLQLRRKAGSAGV
jgi:hypothetical protein